jgi:hypothetical protein
MKKYKYRVIQKKQNDYLNIEKKEISLFSFKYWEYVTTASTIEEADKKIKDEIALDVKPDMTIIKEINPHA